MLLLKKIIHGEFKINMIIKELVTWKQSVSAVEAVNGRRECVFCSAKNRYRLN